MSNLNLPIAELKQQYPAVFKPRMIDGHKGNFGSAVIIGGSTGMTGAALLAAHAALKSGSGKVFIGFVDTALASTIFENHPELMLKTAKESLQLANITAWGIGCGLGISREAESLVEKLLHLSLKNKVVLDADALNIVAELEIQLPYSNSRVLTPHPSEAARLLQCTTQEVQTNRIATVEKLSKQYLSWVVLKGHKTLISSPDGEIWENTTGNVGLATAGSGDVLTGIITGLLAQGIEVKQAVRAGVYLHGLAADYLVKNNIGPIGLTATEIIDVVRLLRNTIAYSSKK